MKYYFLILAVLFLTNIDCSKKSCQTATVVKTTGACSTWAIKVNTNIYPADSIPDRFKRDGASFCVDYSLYEDYRLCACCGGTRAKIISISELPD